MTIFAGNILKNLRKSKQHSQQYLADHLIVSRPTYERYENGTVEIPLSKLCVVARLYQIEPIDLIRQVLNANSVLYREKHSAICACPLHQKSMNE